MLFRSDPSQSDVNKFEKAANSKSPIKLNKVRVGTKRAGFPQDIIIDKKAILEEIDESQLFTRQEMPSQIMEVTIGSLPNLKAGQLVTLMVM